MYWLVKLSPSTQKVCRYELLDSDIQTRGLPSQTASKHRSSQVMTMSATVLLSCQRSGASLSCLFRSSIGRRPLAEYLIYSINYNWKTRTDEAHKRPSLELNSSYIELYGVPNGYMLGLSIEGPGSRTAEPVPYEITR